MKASEEPLIDVSLADRMACRHAISEARVDYAWKHARPDAVKSCGCCTTPIKAAAVYCEQCRREPVQARLPYGEMDR